MKKDIPLTSSLPNGTYIIHDNGLRCFVPPCFSWDVSDLNGRLVAKVSDIDFARVSADSDEMKACLSSEGLTVSGYTIPGNESDGVRQAIIFVVQRVEKSYLLRK